MSFTAKWTLVAQSQYNILRDAAQASVDARKRNKKTRAAAVEGLFKQVHHCIQKLLANPRHPSLNTHEYSSLPHPWSKTEKVFEAYAQNNTPGAYRVFWCYGPAKGEMTIIAITPHP